MKVIHFIALLAVSLSTALAQPARQPVDVSALPHAIHVRMNQSGRFTFDQSGDRLLNPRAVSGIRSEYAVMLQLVEDFGGGASGGKIIVITSKIREKIVHCRGAAHFRGQSGFVTTGEYEINRKDPTAAKFREPIDEFVIYDLCLTDDRKKQG